jgi:hypothetical protein
VRCIQSLEPVAAGAGRIPQVSVGFHATHMSTNSTSISAAGRPSRS